MVTPEEIRQLALLAKLEINEDEIEPLARQMEKIIAFADTINSADVGDTASIPSMDWKTFSAQMRFSPLCRRKKF